MPFAKTYRRKNLPSYRKKVLSNKALTGKVRSLTKNVGQRITDPITASDAFSSVTLTNGTADMNYLDTVGNYMSVPIDNSVYHYMDLWFKLTSTAGSLVRIICGLDMLGSATGVPADILQEPTQVASGYDADNAASEKEFAHSNRKSAFEHAIIKDLSVSLVANEPRLFRVRVPLRGRKAITKAGEARRPWVLCLANSADAIVSVAGHLVYTRDQN